MEEATNSNLRFMDLLDKMARPVDQCSIKIDIGGVFAPPPEWKVADDANPTYFTYKVNFLSAEITGGIFCYRLSYHLKVRYLPGN